MLDHFEVASLMLRRGLLTPVSIVDGNLQIIDASRRNRNFKVVSEDGPCYLLKEGVGVERRATLAREAAAYQLLALDSGASHFAPYIPGCYGYDSTSSILILELMPEALNFTEYHLRLGRFPYGPAIELGEALATLHQAGFNSDGSQRPASTGDASPHWVLSIHKPRASIYHDASATNIALIRILQQFPEFGRAMDDLRNEWRLSRLIHSDIKWDNLILYRGSASAGHRKITGRQSTGNRKKRFKIVDWELWTWGDPSWDVGSVFSSYLNFWLQSIPITGEDTPERLLELARYPLDAMHGAIRTFWTTYVTRMGLGRTETADELNRAVKFAAARLVQTAYEQARAASDLTGNLLCLLQVSLNMLQRPDEAALHLLGIPPQVVRGL